MNDEQLLRYSRQIMLPEIDIEGQQKMLYAKVLVIGLGGLGSPVSMYLAAAGVGQLILVDFDQVDLSNLQRQIVHSTQDIDRDKVDSAHDRILTINPDCSVTTINHRLDASALNKEIRQVDVVIDCSDNFETRFSINQACQHNRVPLVSAAAIRFEGQISVFDPRNNESPCYRCLYNDIDMADETCTQTGVIAPLLGIIGSMQALEAIKLITDSGKTLVGKLLLFDALTNEWQTLRFRKDPDCPVCGIMLKNDF